METKRLLEKLELESHLENKNKGYEQVKEYQKKFAQLQDKTLATKASIGITDNLEIQLEEKIKQLDMYNKERDKLERELVNTKSELTAVKRTLDLERQERRELETKALSLIKGAKRKWENAEKDKLGQLNKHIQVQTLRITELCTSNNEMSSRLQRTECELETANAELHKLRIFQVQHKESLTKLRELNRQSAQGVENKLEEIAARAHNQIADLRVRLELETSKNVDLEVKLRSEQDSNHCRESRLNVALELAQAELNDCQEQLRSLKATIPARDDEIETLKKQLFERTKQLDNTINSEQYVAQMQEIIDRTKLENEQLKQQLETTKTDLNETIVHLEQNDTLALNLEKATKDKATLEQRLQDSLEKEEQHLRKVGNLEELLRRLELSVSKLEAENARLKRKTKELSAATEIIDDSHSSSRAREDNIVVSYNIDGNGKQTNLEQIKKLEQQLQSSREVASAERQTAKQAQIALWKKEKELSDANLDKRIATREAKTAEEKVKKLQEDKQKLSDKLDNKIKDEEEKAKKLLKELEIAKSSLAEVTRESLRNKMQADSAQRALTEANKQLGEVQSSNASLRREVDSIRKQIRTNQERLDSLKRGNERLTASITKHNEEKNELETKLDKMQQEVNSYQVNNELLKETCTVLEEQLTDYERLTSDHEFRENTLIQEKMKLQKELETTEAKLREAVVEQNEEKTMRLVAERTIERLESESSDIEEERNSLIGQRDQYKKLAQQLNKQIAEMTTKCGQLECDLAETQRSLEMAYAESRVVKEESSQHLTTMYELKESNLALMQDLQESVDQGQELRTRVVELEEVLEEMRLFYQERELKAGSTCQQQTKLIDYLQLKLEECCKKKKTVCDKIFGLKQKESSMVTNIGMAMPVGYRELENQLEKERAKVKTLTEQLLAMKVAYTKVSALPEVSSPPSPELKDDLKSSSHSPDYALRLSSQKFKHDVIPHKFNVSLPMRAGKCSACFDSIQFGRRAAICSECKMMTHLKCSPTIPANCGLSRHLRNNSNTTTTVWKNSDESLSSTVESIQTLALDEPDQPTKELMDTNRDNNAAASVAATMESWVKVAARAKSCWERKYLRLEGSYLCTYEHQPSPSMSPISRLDLSEKDGYAIFETVDQSEVTTTAKSDLPFILRIESNSATTCWTTTRMDIMALSQKDKKDWLKALMSVPSKVNQIDKYQTVLRLAKNQLDINCVLELNEEKIILLGAEDGLYSYNRTSKSNVLTAIRGVKKVHQLTLHQQLDLALMIAGEDRQLVSCNLRQLKSNAMAAECSRPAINTKTILTGCESCHLYQVQGEMLCAATATHVILMKWVGSFSSGEFIGLREFETQEPCSCALFTQNKLFVGCNKFFQIDIHTYNVNEFPENSDDDTATDEDSVRATILGVAKLGIFPVSILNVSDANLNGSTELLLCYNEFGVFVNKNGKRTRRIDPIWSHLPFAFAFRKPYLFIVHFSSVDIIRLDSDSYGSPLNKPEKTLIELNNPRYLGLAGSKGIYVAAVDSTLDILKIQGVSISRKLNDSFMSLDTLTRHENNDHDDDGDDESTSEFSFTSSLMEALDDQTKRVHFAKH